MGDKPHKPLLKLRTYQGDQARARGDLPQEITKPETAVIKPTVASEVASLLAEQAKQTPQKVNPPTSLSTTPSTPPAFHELKKPSAKIPEHIVVKKPPAPKTVTVREPVKSEPTIQHQGTEAVVITSGKKSSYSLFSSLGTIFKNWLTKDPPTNETPRYTVSVIDRRKGVIQKATTKSGAEFVTNTDTLKAALKNREEFSASPTPPENTLSWSPNTEPLFALLEDGPAPAILPPQKTVTITYKKLSVPEHTLATKETPTPAPRPKRVFVPPPEQPTEPPVLPELPPLKPPAPISPPPVFKIPPVVPSPSTSTTTPNTASVATSPMQSAPPQVVPVPVRFTKPDTTIPTKPNPKTSYLRRGLSTLFKIDTTVTTVVAVGSLISFFLVFLIVRTFIGMITPATITTTPTSSALPLTPQGVVQDVAISAETTAAFTAALQSQNRPASGVTEFRITNAEGLPLTGIQLWSLLNFSSNPGLSRSITDSRFGYINGEPMIVISVTDAVTAFGALLSWEQNLPQEVASVFQVAPRPVTAVTDETIADSDIRIIKNEADVLVVYGFIDKDTVVITTSVAAYQTVVSQK